MQYLHQQEKAFNKDGNKALTQEEANKVAATTKKKFAVFTPESQRLRFAASLAAAKLNFQD
jgi:hypothetical protein